MISDSRGRVAGSWRECSPSERRPLTSRRARRADLRCRLAVGVPCVSMSVIAVGGSGSCDGRVDRVLERVVIVEVIEVRSEVIVEAAPVEGAVVGFDETMGVISTCGAPAPPSCSVRRCDKVPSKGRM